MPLSSGKGQKMALMETIFIWYNQVVNWPHLCGCIMLIVHMIFFCCSKIQPLCSPAQWLDSGICLCQSTEMMSTMAFVYWCHIEKGSSQYWKLKGRGVKMEQMEPSHHRKMWRNPGRMVMMKQYRRKSLMNFGHASCLTLDPDPKIAQGTHNHVPHTR